MKPGPKKGYKQTAAHTAAIAAAVPRGPRHHAFKGDNATPKTGRLRAEQLFAAQPCEVCGKGNAERHHIDGNPLNNVTDNIRFLCRRHHMEVDGRLARMRVVRAAGRSK